MRSSAPTREGLNSIGLIDNSCATERADFEPDDPEHKKGRSIAAPPDHIIRSNQVMTTRPAATAACRGLQIRRHRRKSPCWRGGNLRPSRGEGPPLPVRERQDRQAPQPCCRSRLPRLSLWLAWHSSFFAWQQIGFCGLITVAIATTFPVRNDVSQRQKEKMHRLRSNKRLCSRKNQACGGQSTYNPDS